MKILKSNIKNRGALRMSRETIAKVLKRLRDQSGLTADQVGASVGKSGKTVNAWENNRGQPDAEILIKLCDIYNVSDILAEFRETPQDAFALSKHEKTVITAYRNNPEMQPAVDRILNVSKEINENNNVNNKADKTITVFKAAMSTDGQAPSCIEVSEEILQRLEDAPPTDEKF